MNLHIRRYWILNPTRLPIPPRPRGCFHNVDYFTCFLPVCQPLFLFFLSMPRRRPFPSQTIRAALAAVSFQTARSVSPFPSALPSRFLIFALVPALSPYPRLSQSLFNRLIPGKIFSSRLPLAKPRPAVLPCSHNARPACHSF